MWASERERCCRCFKDDDDDDDGSLVLAGQLGRFFIFRGGDSEMGRRSNEIEAVVGCACMMDMIFFALSEGLSNRETTLT